MSIFMDNGEKCGYPN